jgi:tRNA pseudouridine55 synthase
MGITDGFLNLLKPPGMTSHDVVAMVRRQFGARRVGHLGTLDPAAAGVLPICLGRATRLFQHAAGPDKAYRAEVVFGVATDTLDAEGRITAEGDASRLNAEMVRQALSRFLGEISQRVPAFSAARVGGVRLYELARRGEYASAPEKRVHIFDLRLVSFQAGETVTALLDLVCSPGTYVRSLAADLGQALGCGAHLGFLVRTRAGRFELSETITLEELSAAAQAGTLESCLIALDRPLSHLPAVTLAARHEGVFLHGGRVLTQPQPAAVARVYGPTGLFLGLGEVLSGGQLRPTLVLSSAEGEQQ